MSCDGDEVTLGQSRVWSCHCKGEIWSNGIVSCSLTFVSFSVGGLKKKIQLLKRWFTCAKSHIQGESENG